MCVSTIRKNFMNVLLNVQRPNAFYNPTFMNNSDHVKYALNVFSNKIENKIKEDKFIHVGNNRKRFLAIATQAKKEGIINEFTKSSKSLIEKLVQNKNYGLAGAICSILIRFNKEIKNMKDVEDLSRKALAIATDIGDTIHIAARANDLSVMLQRNNPGSSEHIKYLKIQNEALEYICENYDECIVKNNKMFFKEHTPLDNYKDALLYTKLNIAKYALMKEPQLAEIEFKKAKNIFAEIKSKYSEEKSKQLEHRINILERRYKMYLSKNTPKHTGKSHNTKHTKYSCSRTCGYAN